MTTAQALKIFLDKNNGIIKSSQAHKIGISKPAFYEYVKQNNLVKAANGIYHEQNAWADLLYFNHLRFKQAIFSHETALYLHDLTNREPLNYSVTVKTGYNPTHLKMKD